ncbi:MAG TPA: polysaccharide deacetylase family protein [Sporichthyaceae bacterium]|jgi:peptidoglycan/xylan/chitin deacetylase (PgdA/CDA1 family)|nr:polysaccharide deacetylase family protein [Sporichthyaceae bacterium]
METENSGISRRALVMGAAGLALGGGLAGCSQGQGLASAQAQPAAPAAPAAPEATHTPTAAPSPAAADPASVKANELGLIPVMMFHRLTENIQGDYDTTPAEFRRRLQTMFAAGYRPVRTIDLVNGKFDMPAGYTPAVMTFDDGYTEQFGMDAAGNVDPASAVGIMLDVCKQFPDCKPAGSLNINKDPFGISDPAAQKAALAKLTSLGFEIGNHTFNHDNLGKLADTAVEADFVQLQEMVTAAAPDLPVRTMALPFGVRPQDLSLLHTGSWNGQDYTFDGVLLVGANPAPSPFATAFNPLAIPRIRNATGHGDVDYAATYWMNYLTAHPEARYVTAGNPGHVTVPKSAAGKVAPAYRDRLITY